MTGQFELVDGRELRYADIVSATPSVPSFVPLCRGACKPPPATQVSESGHQTGNRGGDDRCSIPRQRPSTGRPTPPSTFGSADFHGHRKTLRHRFRAEYLVDRSLVHQTAGADQTGVGRAGGDLL
jgi:hypothetical protein